MLKQILFIWLCFSALTLFYGAQNETYIED